MFYKRRLCSVRKTRLLHVGSAQLLLVPSMCRARACVHAHTPTYTRTELTCQMNRIRVGMCVLFRTARDHKRGTSGAVCSPAITLVEVQVHIVARDEGTSVQRELHTARVRDGLTQQGHVAPCRG